MRGTVAKKLRRQAKNETEEKKYEDAYFTGRGQKLLTTDCTKGRYRFLKELYKYARKYYKKMPKLQIVSKEVSNW